MSFAVDGILLLGSLSITRAFLEVSFTVSLARMCLYCVWLDSVLCDLVLGGFIVAAS